MTVHFVWLKKIKLLVNVFITEVVERTTYVFFKTRLDTPISRRSGVYDVCNLFAF